MESWIVKEKSLKKELHQTLESASDQASLYLSCQMMLDHIFKKHGSLSCLPESDTSNHSHFVSSKDPLVEYLNTFLGLYDKEESSFMLSVQVVKESFTKLLKEWESESLAYETLFQECQIKAKQFILKEQEIIQNVLETTHCPSQMQVKEQLDFEYHCKSKIEMLQPVLRELANL